MSNKEKSKKLICSICGQDLLKNANISGKPYAIRKIDPVICDFCSQNLAALDDENQEILEAKRYSKILKNSLKAFDQNFTKSVEASVNHQNINLTEIITKVKSVIKGQDEHVKTITTAIYKNQKIEQTELKSNLIILGDSGSGKTEIIKLLAEEFKIPYVIEDATRYTEAGYVGASVDDMIYNLFKVAKNNIARAERGILIIDEGDKKGSTSDIGRDVSGENVLFSLLKIIEGSKVPIADGYGDIIGYLDTSKLTIVFIGAFPKLAEIREKRLKKKGVIGFGNIEKEEGAEITEYIAQDFINGGFPKEFIGRFDRIIELNKLTTENLEDITRNSKKSTFIHYKEELEKKNIDLIYQDEVITEIALLAKKLDIGARGIKKIIQEMFKDIMYNVLISEEDTYSKCIITKETVNDPFNYQLH